MHFYPSDLLASGVSDAFTAAQPGSYLALVLVIAVLCQWLASRLRVPGILVLLVVGFGLGQLISPEEIIDREMLFGGTTLAVGVILFEGSLTLKFKQIRDLGTSVRRLCTVVVLIAWALITAAALLIGYDWRIALLAGAILVVTGPTVISPILRQLRPTRRVASLLRWEGIVVDPIGAVLAVLVYQAIVAGQDGAIGAVVLGLLYTLAIGFGIGLGVGWVMAQLTRRHLIPDFLDGIAYLAAALGALTLSNMLQHETGLLTVTVMGIYLANRADLHLERVLEFKEHLQVLFVGVLFVLLAGRITWAQLVDVLPQALLFLALLVIVVRPVSIFVGLWGSDATTRERILLAAMAPRGIVAAAIMSIFALQLDHAAAGVQNGPRSNDLTLLADQADTLVPLVFAFIVGSVTIYGLGVGRLAERLGLASTNPTGVVFAGAPTWAVQAAQRVAEDGTAVKVVTRDYSAVKACRSVGVDVEFTHILSEYAADDMPLAGFGTLLAVTSDDEVNATAARQFAPVFGKPNVYQLKRHEEATLSIKGAKTKALPARHLTAPSLGSPALTFEELDHRTRRGMRVRSTKLTEAYTLDDFRSRYGDQATILLAKIGGRYVPVTDDTVLPRSGTTLISQVPGGKAANAEAARANGTA
ncbi:sodium:proton antiporter [Blastococcus sp. Marseille-P5729]|uniref:cation:proton antiporter n=1 Tax=Blastococcus sp. Marseille-P5729 TaxID=2086582 RepID=UPI0018FE827E|nr:sodium:proton antiporter [Blastococcus sp. Marseille-P5729]